MSKPRETSLDFFLHDTSAMQDKKIRIFTGRTGLAGYGFFWAITEMIYGDEGYYMKFDSEYKELFISDHNRPFFPVDLDVLNTLLMKALDAGLFNKEIYNEYNVLTSRSIQERFIGACKRRKSVELIKNYLLFDVDKFVDEELGSTSLKIKYVNAEGQGVLDLVGGSGHNPQKNVEKDVDNVNKEDEDVNTDTEDVYDLMVTAWNDINNSRCRLTKKKKKDIDRALEQYTKGELINALQIRARSTMLKPAHRKDWNTFFGRKKLENVDKWVDRAHEFEAKEKKAQSLADHKNNGWVHIDTAQKLADERGFSIDDGIWFEQKKVEGRDIYLPKFTV